MNLNPENFPPRPAWTEIDLGKLRRNLQLIRGDLPKHVRLMAVVKDEAYGHGALDIARVAVEEGAWGFGLSTLEEAMTLRDAGITAPLLLLGERQEAELEWCVAHDLTVCVNEPHAVRKLAKIAADFGKQIPVHVKVHTGMSRYGVRWDEALPLIEQIVAGKSLRLEGVMSHFSQSDETDKTFANLHFPRLHEVLQGLPARGTAMDALMVDITDIHEAQMWDEAVIMGRQGGEEITVHDIAKMKNSVSYEVLTSWRLRLRRKSVNNKTAPEKIGQPIPVAK